MIKGFFVRPIVAGCACAAISSVLTNVGHDQSGYALSANMFCSIVLGVAAAFRLVPE